MSSRPKTLNASNLLQGIYIQQPTGRKIVPKPQQEVMPEIGGRIIEATGSRGLDGRVGPTGAIGLTGATGPRGLCDCPSLEELDRRYLHPTVNEIKSVQIIPDEMSNCNAIISVVPALKINETSRCLSYDTCTCISSQNGISIKGSDIYIGSAGVYQLTFNACLLGGIPGAVMHITLESQHVLMNPFDMMLTIPTNRVVFGSVFITTSDDNQSFKLTTDVDGNIMVESGTLLLRQL